MRRAVGARTVNGSVVDTEFGQFQVRATFRDHALTDVRLVAEPGDGPLSGRSVGSSSCAAYEPPHGRSARCQPGEAAAAGVVER